MPTGLALTLCTVRDRFRAAGGPGAPSSVGALRGSKWRRQHHRKMLERLGGERATRDTQRCSSGTSASAMETKKRNNSAAEQLRAEPSSKKGKRPWEWAVWSQRGGCGRPAQPSGLSLTAHRWVEMLLGLSWPPRQTVLRRCLPIFQPNQQEGTGVGVTLTGAYWLHRSKNNHPGPPWTAS